MLQVVSSAIVNAPPPDGLVKALHLMNFAERGDVNPQTRTKMVCMCCSTWTDELERLAAWCPSFILIFCGVVEREQVTGKFLQQAPFPHALLLSQKSVRTMLQEIALVLACSHRGSG